MLPNLIRNYLAKPCLAFFALVCLLSAIPSGAYCAGKGKPTRKTCETCTINGPTSITQGSGTTYTLSGCTTVSWTVSNGNTIQRYTTTSVTIIFNNIGTCNIETAGATGGGATLNVSVTAAPLASGGINNPSQSINYGATPAQLTANAATGGTCSGSYTYQWYSSTNGSTYTPISGATGLTYQPGALTTTTHFEQVVSCNGITATSNIATVTVYPQLAGGSISPATQSINYNTTPSTLTLSGYSGGNSSYTYQWQSSSSSSFSSITDVGTGTTTYTPGALTATTYYRVAVTSNGVTAYSSTATVTVYPQLTGGSITPATQTINYNTTPSTLTLSGVSGGSSSYTYQWQSSSSSSFSSITNVGTGTTTYTPGALTATTYYRVAVTSNGVTAYSSTATVTVYPQLAGGSITPATQTINYNTTPSTLTLSGVSGGNSSYTYQWQSSSSSSFSSITDVGTGTTTYTPGALTATTYYRVAVTSNGVTAYSSTATVTVYPQLAGGSISPSSQAINYNTAPSTLTSSGVSGGSGTYTYQWQSSPDNSTWSNISGQTSTSYSPPALTATTYYRLVVISNGVSANSASATVTVYAALQGGSISPATQTINYNATPSTLTLSGVSGGSGTYTYQWQSSPDNSTWSNISSATSSSYSPGALTATTYYRVVVTSNGGTANSASATVTVYPAIQGGTISPASQSINYNTTPSTLTLSGVSGGNGTYTYQWQSSPDNSTWTNITGASATTYSPGALTATTYYRVVVTSNSATASSPSATVTVYPTLQSGSISPSSQAINYNTAPSTLTSSGVSGGSGTYTYQWQSSTNNSTWTNISGATSSTYSPGPLTASTYYQLVVTSNGVSATSSSVEITVYTALQAGAINPASQSIPLNTTPSSLSLTGVLGGNGSYSYVWQASTDDVNWSNAGSTTTSFQPGALTANTYYRVAVTSSGQTLYSGIASVTSSLSGGVISGPGSPIGYGTSPGTLGNSQPAGGGICTNYSYQWQYSLNGSTWYNLPNATGASYSPTPLTTSIYFRRQVTCSGTTVTSNTLYVQVTNQGQPTSCPIGQ
jgi:hypothetical protein